MNPTLHSKSFHIVIVLVILLQSSTKRALYYRLHFIGQAISDQTETAERHFTQLLRINPQSVNALRNYARFLLEVVNNNEKVKHLHTCRST